MPSTVLRGVSLRSRSGVAVASVLAGGAVPFGSWAGATVAERTTMSIAATPGTVALWTFVTSISIDTVRWSIDVQVDIYAINFPATCSRVISPINLPAGIMAFSGVIRANKSRRRATVPVHPV